MSHERLKESLQSAETRERFIGACRRTTFYTYRAAVHGKCSGKILMFKVVSAEVKCTVILQRLVHTCNTRYCYCVGVEQLIKDMTDGNYRFYCTTLGQAALSIVLLIEHFLIMHIYLIKSNSD